MNFLNFGYYIIEPFPTPEYLNLTCEQILTISECICNVHPSLELYRNQCKRAKILRNQGEFSLANSNFDTTLLTGLLFRPEPEPQLLQYKKSLSLSDEEFTELQEVILRLYDERSLDVDSRFTKLSDALLFCKKYLYNQPNIKVVSLALEKAYKDAFIEEAGKCLNATLLENQKNDGDFLGYDILGWEFGSFHTYLCNGLNQDISDKYPLEVNKYGLLQNPYSQVKIFSEYIDGEGEPVMWLPFAVYEHLLK